MARMKRSIIKIERWRLALWKHQLIQDCKTDIIDPDDPINKFVVEYSNGRNDGLMLALSWFEKYVEGKK